ncbi:hypothetical protein [Nocardiopsis potens]|uniref:hypothetical protein n=1 Tax=Nocardiopsis potens TaxID=1246458 RepID=UPI000346573B|nr:hypothetical protein [Nocardiopsis potens]
MSSSTAERAEAEPRRLPLAALITAALLAVPLVGGTAYLGMFVNVPPPCALGEATEACARATREGYHHPASTAFYVLAALEAAVVAAGWALSRRLRWAALAALAALPLVAAGGLLLVVRLFGSE